MIVINQITDFISVTLFLREFLSVGVYGKKIPISTLGAILFHIVGIVKWIFIPKAVSREPVSISPVKARNERRCFPREQLFRENSCWAVFWSTGIQMWWKRHKAQIPDATCQHF